MKSKSKICRTSRFRWVRNRVIIVSQDEFWPGKERQVKSRKMHCKISLFPTSYVISLLFSKAVISPNIFMEFLMSQQEYQNPGNGRGVIFKGLLMKSMVKIDSGCGPYAHSTSQTNSCNAGPHPSIQNMLQSPAYRVKGPKKRNNQRLLSHLNASSYPRQATGYLISGNLQDGDIPASPWQLVPLRALQFASLGWPSLFSPVPHSLQMLLL